MSQSEVQPGTVKRQRRGGTKSRHGCSTCKIRRVKCDETRPHCQKCLSTGRQCDGYASDVVPANKFQFVPQSTILSFSSPKQSLVTERESQHLNMFRYLFISTFSGFHNRSGWESLILQAMHEEPAVRHAAIAFTALQLPARDESSGKPSKGSKSFALQQYGKSVKAFQTLLDQRDSHSTNAALICSVLCISFDVLDGSHILAQQHLENGLRVLAENTVDENIAQSFARLDIQASIYVGRRPPAINYAMSTKGAILFNSLDEAESSLYQMLSDVWSFVRNRANQYRFQEPDVIPMDILMEAEAIKSRLEQWEVAYTRVEGALEMTARWNAQQAKVLKIHQKDAVVTMIGALHAEEAVYDAWDSTFEDIVRLAGELHSDSSASPSAKTFSIEMGILQPLSSTAAKCRVPKIRRQAIKLLQAVPHSEGVFNGQLMAKVASLVKETEEAGLDETFLNTQRVPEFRRVHSVDMDVEPKARRAMISLRTRPNGMDGEWEDTEYFVTW